MKRLISILLTVVMLFSMLVAVIPVSAATVTTETTDTPLKFKSGLDNLWFTEKAMTAMPKTIEATIDVPATWYDTYEGQVVAWYSVNSSTGHYLWVDLVRKDASNKDASANLGLRVLVKNGTTEMTKVYYDSLNAYVGQKMHFAITVDSAVNLYINGELYTGGSFITGGDKTETQLVSVYNSIDVSKIPALSFGGDDRNPGTDSRYPKTHFYNYRYFKGGIYNMCVFSDVRSATEIAADKNSVDTSAADNILMAYNTANMDTGAKNITDISGNGYDLKRVFHGKSFTSGFDNLYSSKTQVTVLPKTFEATIYVPTSADDQYWGDIMAWCDHGEGDNYIVWDLRDPPNTGTGLGAMVRFLVKSNGTGATLDFSDSLEAYKGQTVHVALTIDTTVKLYVNGTEHTTVSGDAASAATIYNSMDLSKLVMPSIGGDFRTKIADSQWTVHHVDNYRWFRGKIFSVATFTDVRSTTEIAADVNTLPVQGADNILMSYDLFDETEVGIIPDKSGNGYNMAKPLMWLDAADKVEITDYGYSFVVVGDTQVLTIDEVKKDDAKLDGNMDKLYDWIVSNQQKKNIQFAFHMGDVTDNSRTDEWALAQNNFNKLAGKLPNNIARGNHDSAPNMVNYYTTQMFENSVMAGEEFGYFDGRGIAGYTANTLNTYQTITVGDVMYLMLALDLGPCKAVIEWANEVIAAHPYHNVIISTHSYLQGDYDNDNYAGAEHYPYMDAPKDCAATQYNPGGYYGPGGEYGVNWDFRLQQHKDGGENYLYQDATYMLNNLVKKHSNISMVLCGHECSEYVKQISATGEAGNNVLQFLVDGQLVDRQLQQAGDGHAGLVGMFYFSEDGKKVTTEYYSTTRNQYLHDFMNVNTYDVNVVEVPTSVKAFYATMHSLDASNYTPAVWADISEKLEATKQIVTTSTNLDTIDTEVAAFTAAVEAADTLDYEPLENAIDAAEGLVETDYSVADWNAIQTAIAEAEEKKAAATTQTALSEATAELNALVSGTAKINRTALNDAITVAGNKVQDDYTPASWAEFEAALANARSMLDSRNQADIDAATAQLAAATLALDEKNVSTDEITSITVNGVYNAGSSAAEVISVDVSWGSMTFTYNDAVEGVWNDDTHKYDGAAQAYWSCESDANKITVTNHSNTDVEAQLTFVKADGTNIAGSFTETVGTANDGIMLIATAVGTEVANAPKAEAYFNIDSGTIAASGKLGTITLKIVNK